MNGPVVPTDRTLLWRVVLAAAMLAAFAAWQVPTTSPAHAQPAPSPATKAAADTGKTAKDAGNAAAKPAGTDAGAGKAARDASKASAAPAKAADAADKSGADEEADADSAAKKDEALTAEITVGPHGVTVNKHGRRVRVFGIQGDREYDSFNDLVESEPWLAGLVFFAVALVFAVPLLIVIAVIWYKMRRARLLNETMLRLAEKGLVPPPGALEALGANKADAMAQALASSAPAVEQVRLARRRAAWSDLRKGIVMIAFGLGLSFFSILDDGTPNSVGLVLLFLGIGYIVLWRFEERHLAPTGGGPPAGA